MTEFDKLPIHQQRAVQNEVNRIIEARKISKTFGELYSNQVICDKNAEALKFHISQNKNKVNELVERDSEELFLYPLAKDRIMHFKLTVKEMAESIDRTYQINNKKSR